MCIFIIIILIIHDFVESHNIPKILLAIRGKSDKTFKLLFPEPTNLDA